MANNVDETRIETLTSAHSTAHTYLTDTFTMDTKRTKHIISGKRR